ncbi:MAG: hypothetical protein ACXADA_10725 [Candidatus Hodarchaeales archaeon]|jgi:phage FluMu protein Com
MTKNRINYLNKNRMECYHCGQKVPAGKYRRHLEREHPRETKAADWRVEKELYSFENVKTGKTTETVKKQLYNKGEKVSERKAIAKKVVERLNKNKISCNYCGRKVNRTKYRSHLEKKHPRQVEIGDWWLKKELIAQPPGSKSKKGRKTRATGTSQTAGYNKTLRENFFNKTLGNTGSKKYKKGRAFLDRDYFD